MKNRIKELRQENNLTLRQLGEKLDMKNSTLSQYETGKREPKIETWRKLADFFGTTVSYLQGEDTVLKARDLFFEISILADLYPGLHDQLKAIEDHYGIGYGYENLKKIGVMKMTPYKAWDVFRLHGDGVEHEIAYADSRNEAKYKVLNHECKTDGELTNDPDIEYLDLSARRLKVCDGLGDEPLSVVAETAMKKADWVWTMDGVEYTADDISDEESLEEFKSLFDE